MMMAASHLAGGNKKPPPGAIRWVFREFDENSREEHIGSITAV